VDKDKLLTRRMMRAWLMRISMIQEPPGVRVEVMFSAPYFRFTMGRLPWWSHWIGFN
jgi:hypothetical protein